jgi:hypothetical protein
LSYACARAHTHTHTHTHTRRYTWTLPPDDAMNGVACVVSPTFTVLSQWEMRFRHWPKTGDGGGMNAKVFVEFRRPFASSVSHPAALLNNSVLTVEWDGGKTSNASTSSHYDYSSGANKKVTTGATLAMFDVCVGARQWHSIHSFKCSKRHSFRTVAFFVSPTGDLCINAQPHYRLTSLPQYTLFKKASSLLVSVAGAARTSVVPFLTGCMDTLTEKVRCPISVTTTFTRRSSAT